MSKLWQPSLVVYDHTIREIILRKYCRFFVIIKKNNKQTNNELISTNLLLNGTAVHLSMCLMILLCHCFTASSAFMSIFNDDVLPEEINRSHCLLIAVMFTPPKSHLPRLLLVSLTTRLSSQSVVQFLMRLKAEETLGKLNLWWLPSNYCRAHQCIPKEKYVRRNILSSPKDNSKSRNK